MGIYIESTVMIDKTMMVISKFSNTSSGMVIPIHNENAITHIK